MPVFPSTAAEAGNEEFSTEEEVAVLPWESRVALAAASLALSGAACWPRDETPANTATRASAATRADSHRYRDLRQVGWCGIGLINCPFGTGSALDPDVRRLSSRPADSPDLLRPRVPQALDRSHPSILLGLIKDLIFYRNLTARSQVVKAVQRSFL